MRNYITFGGTDSRTYGVYISGTGVFNAPSRAYDMQSISGRNGAVLGADKHLENLELTYPAFVYADFKNNIQAWRSLLLSKHGYQRLTDTYYPDEYRMALYAGPFDVDAVANLTAGSFDMTFSCLPQRYLLTGETPVTMTATGNITNPTVFPSKPLLKVLGKGSLVIGGVTVTVLDHPYTSAGIYIDCELMDAYYVSGATVVNMNRYISLANNKFPEIPAGTSSIGIGTGISSVIITPRWWQL